MRHQSSSRLHSSFRRVPWLRLMRGVRSSFPNAVQGRTGAYRFRRCHGAAQGDDGQDHGQGCGLGKGFRPEADGLFIDVRAQHRDIGRNSQKRRYGEIVDAGQERQQAAADDGGQGLLQIHLPQGLQRAEAAGPGRPIHIQGNLPQGMDDTEIHDGGINKTQHGDDAWLGIDVDEGQAQARQQTADGGLGG